MLNLNENYSHYYKNPLLKIFAIIEWPIALLSYIIPKKKGLVIYGSMNGYNIADNSKYKFTHEYKNDSYFICKRKSILNIDILPNIHPVYAYSIKGILLQLRAEISFYSHSIYDFIPSLIYGSNITALWHGVPLKIIGPEADNKNSNKFKLIIKFIITKLFPYSYYMYCNNVICPNKELISDYANYFSISKPKLIIEKQPRNTYCKVITKTNKILYAPTYRNYKSIIEIMNESMVFSDQFIDFLKKNNIILVIRTHPIDRKVLLNLPSSVKFNNIIIDNSIDLYESISEYNLIITDFSSIYYDSLEIGTNCLLIAPDLKIYSKNVGLTNYYIDQFNKIGKTNFIDLIPLLEEELQKLNLISL